MKALIRACGLHIHCDTTLFSVCMHVRVGLKSGGRVKQMCEHNLEGMEKELNVYVCVCVSENISNCVLHQWATETHLIARHLKGRMIEPAIYTSALRITPSLWRLVNRKGKRPWDILSNRTMTFLFQWINFVEEYAIFIFSKENVCAQTLKKYIRNYF